MYQAKNQNDNVIEYAGRENNLSKEKEYLIFVNPDTGKEKKVKAGIGYDFLFLGIFAFLFRGFIKEFFVSLALLAAIDFLLLALFNIEMSETSSSIVVGVTLSRYGNFYAACSLSKKGWRLENPSDKLKECALKYWKNFGRKKRRSENAFETWLYG